MTNTMLGSRDGWVVGSYDLMLSALKKGTHTIELTVADDGKGDGCFWLGCAGASCKVERKGGTTNREQRVLDCLLLWARFSL